MSDFTPVNDPAGSYEQPAIAAKSFPNSYHYYMHFEWLPRRTDGKPNFLVARRLPFDSAASVAAIAALPANPTPEQQQAAAAAGFPAADAAHPQDPLANPEIWSRGLRVNDTNALATQFPGVQRLMNTIHLALTAIEALQVLEPQVEAVNQGLQQATAAKQQADQQLADAQQAQAALPPDATDQQKADTQALVDAATTAAGNAATALTNATTLQQQVTQQQAAIVAQLQ